MKKYGFILIITYAFMSLFVTAGAFAMEDQEFSETENRVLTQWPGCELFAMAEETDASGSADLTAIENYLCDQFPAREEIVNGYTNALTRTGRWYVRGVRILHDNDALENAGFYFGPDYLFLPSYAVNEKMLNRFCEVLELSIAQSPVATIYVPLPQKPYSLADGSAGQVDNTIDKANQEILMDTLRTVEGVIPIDICSTLLETYSPAQRAEMYYKGDYHWNDLGAFRACKILAEKLAQQKIIPQSAIPVSSSFEWRDYGDDYWFSGDLARRFEVEKDYTEFIPFYYPEEVSQIKYYLDPNGTAQPRSSIVGRGFDPEVAKETLTQQEKDYLSNGEITYNMVTTLNLPYIRIENPNAKAKRTVVVIKDSYENACTDYLTTLFSEIIIIDPRYEVPSISELVETRHVDLVMYMFLQNNISEELIKYVEKDLIPVT